MTTHNSSLRRGLILTGFAVAIAASFAVTALLIGKSAITDGKLDYTACMTIKKVLDPHLPCGWAATHDPAASADREALGSVIRTLCLPAGFLGLRSPCERVNYRDGCVIIRAPGRDFIDFIVSPIRKIAGIESRETLAMDAPNLWAAAWEERSRVDAAAAHKLGWKDYALVVNSRETRSQDQLHIHLGCLDRRIKEYFHFSSPITTGHWGALRLDWLSSNFFAKIIDPSDLQQNLFRMIAREAPAARLQPDQQSVALAPIEKGAWRGFVLLSSFDPVPAERFPAKACVQDAEISAGKGAHAH